jgi:hypothetical protein
VCTRLHDFVKNTIVKIRKENEKISKQLFKLQTNLEGKIRQQDNTSHKQHKFELLIKLFRHTKEFFFK